MTTDSHIGACLFRARDAFERRPAAALLKDSPALAIWDGALGAKLSHAAMRGVKLKRVEVQANSESDARGMLGSAPGVPPGPLRFWLTVTLDAHDVPQDALRELVASAHAHAPMSGALMRPVDVAVDLHLAAADGA